MSFIVDLVRKRPKGADVAYFVRAALSRPGDIPWILRREAAKRRAGQLDRKQPDALGLRCVTDSWEAAIRAGFFRAPPGSGAHLTVTPALVRSPLEVVSALQTAGGATFLDLADAPVFPLLSLEAARFGLRQTATDRDRAVAARRAFVERAEVSAPLRAALMRLADQPIRSA